MVKDVLVWRLGFKATVLGDFIKKFAYKRQQTEVFWCKEALNETSFEKSILETTYLDYLVYLIAPK